jgi:hypothetical protein
MSLCTYHVSIASRNAIASHGPEQRVQRCSLLTEEVPCGVVRSCALWHLPVRSGLDTVDEIGKLDSILDEEHRNIVANNVKVALVSIAEVNHMLVMVNTRLHDETPTEDMSFRHNKLTILSRSHGHLLPCRHCPLSQQR